MRRRDLLGSVPAGTGGFIANIFTAYPQEATIEPIAQSYSEYRYTRYILQLVPAASSSTTGNGFICYQMAPPFAPTDLAQAAAISRFRSGPGFGRNTSSGLDCSGRSRRWFRVVQGALTSAQSVDPDIVQAWPTLGSQGVQSGLSAWDVYLSYTIQLRGSLPSTTNLTPAVISRFTNADHYTNDDDEESST